LVSATHPQMLATAMPNVTARAATPTAVDM
jgi:hypothetical protein